LEIPKYKKGRYGKREETGRGENWGTGGKSGNLKEEAE
jgi:hypothetical protein